MDNNDHDLLTPERQKTINRNNLNASEELRIKQNEIRKNLDNDSYKALIFFAALLAFIVIGSAIYYYSNAVNDSISVPSANLTTNTSTNMATPTNAAVPNNNATTP